MSSLNRVQLIGYLGRDPEIRNFDNGGMVANATLATTERWKDKQTGEAREATEWHRLVFNGKLAEIVSTYLQKGALIYAEGSLRTRKWTDNHGIEKYSTEVRVDEMRMLGGRNERGAAPAASDDQAPSRVPAPARPATPAPRPTYAAAGAGAGSGFEDMDDDIPY
jgi:single-strand DNA-binding protein